MMTENKSIHSIEERVELSLLYDFYGALLKENQQRMFEASILEDYNLSEIAHDEGITRQGVHDAIKRASKQLRIYEEKLGLVAKFEEQKRLVKELGDKLKKVNIHEKSSFEGQEHKDEMKEIFRILEEILEE